MEVDNLTLNASIALADKDIPLAQENINQAEDVLSRMVKETSVYWRITIYSLKAKLAVSNNDFQKAYHLQTEVHSLFKSYQNSEREKIRSKYKVMFDTDQALLKNQVLQRDQKLDKAALRYATQQQKLQTLIISIISVFSIVLVWFIFKQWQTGKLLHRLANTDGLTKLANRRYSFIYAEKMMSLAKKSDQRLAIITFDIDLFKLVNDTYGHSGGDIALKSIAAVANDYVRANDILGRIGGEEFLLILPNTSAQQAMVIAERIRIGIEEKELKVADNLVNITASFGVAELNSKKQKFSELFNDADVALYQAKNNGRNQVTLAKKN
jgi:diguanylate cyclase (GGDEF)-like protein